MYNKIAVIGDKDSVLAFKAVGVDVVDALTFKQAEDAVKKLTKEEYAVVLITETLAAGIPEVLSKAKTKPFPVIVPIPTSSGSTGFGMEGIKKDVEKAIGTDILFNKEED
ncbi:MAG: hypothetical protein NC350_02560 [Corallococcus sp.]|nr:hypothetical protein [Corallococcus sp.]